MAFHTSPIIGAGADEHVFPFAHSFNGSLPLASAVAGEKYSFAIPLMELEEVKTSANLPTFSRNA